MEPEKHCIECSLRFVPEEQSAGHLIFPRHAAARGWGFARYGEWREKEPGDLDVFAQ